MADYKETHEITTNTGEKKGGATPWLAFLVGALLVAVIAILLMNAEGSFSGPGGEAEFNIKSPITQSEDTVRTVQPAAPERPAQPAPAK